MVRRFFGMHVHANHAHASSCHDSSKERMMLPSSLFDWWFAPWLYALDADLRLPLTQDRLAQRDGYRLWCAKAHIESDFPVHFHGAWSIAITSNVVELMATARLFSGLMAAREHDQLLLGSLSLDDRKWCLSVAATQPLSHCPHVAYGLDDGIEVRGLVELARRLESGFPGLWSRLQLMLSRDLAARVASQLEHAVLISVEPDAALLRAQRCWRLCRARVDSLARDAAVIPLVQTSPRNQQRSTQVADHTAMTKTVTQPL